ncbi:chemotaxis protein CheB [Amycolatopsis rubida]|uniref:protein-glutamate methylesterase n=1 Tax=Amycolatopsis rubida TaxID=112413 RepID=A0ABX0BYH1_9PSEU|nr:chemotaxis protein CheB [Amycolatopsis sp. M39]MYW94215.1 chemotaxis protein CheB [Amycolatopsis rubida]NEC59204.1 chemotaxis protein CheB [Amycolatopsis rubida]OAP20850.1 Chemotaxis response regulator protein-glutamate methylesterase [Amycolatopsis sp. M39]
MSEVRRDIVVAGASAGGVEALRSLVGSLPADFPATVLVTMHLSAGARSALPMILDRSGPLPAAAATHGAPLRAGVVYVAPPDRHLLTDDGSVILTQGPTENGHRPAINAMFRSAAVTAGPRTVGVVLSGTLDDGAAGLRAIVARGGEAVVQDPADAVYSGMPSSALAAVGAARVLPAAELGGALDKMVRMPLEPADVPPPSRALLLEDRIARDGVRLGAVRPEAAQSSAAYTCPDCHGTLTEVASGQYRCRIGHAWSPEALLLAQDTEFQRAVWTALRSLDEKVALAERLEHDARHRHHSLLTERYAGTARECLAAANTLREFLLSLSDKPRAEDP